MDVDPGRRRRLRHPWRLLTPIGFAAAGVLMVTSAVTSGGTDLRPGHYDDLADLARTESHRIQDLRAESTQLNADITRLTREVKGPALRQAQQRVATRKAPAGLTAVTGPGITVTLQDAPKQLQESAGGQVADAIVHQQDIQAVANAMWAGGAEAMTIQGQRVVSTTGIKCVGNTVLLHGVTYSPPYVLSAIGDVAAMRASIQTSPYIRAYLQAVQQWRLGWDLRVEDRIEAPAYDGPTDLSYARPAGAS